MTKLNVADVEWDDDTPTDDLIANIAIIRAADEPPEGESVSSLFVWENEIASELYQRAANNDQLAADWVRAEEE
jgi:hypothetical protein